jgi:hypothetical protein
MKSFKRLSDPVEVENIHAKGPGYSSQYRLAPSIQSSQCDVESIPGRVQIQN